MENAFRALGAFLARHFAGGAVWLYVGGFIVTLGLIGYVQLLEGKIDRLETKLSAAQSESQSKTGTIESQSRQKQRTDKATKDLKNVEDEISRAPNPIEYSYQWLYEHRRSQSAGDPNE